MDLSPAILFLLLIFISPPIGTCEPSLWAITVHQINQIKPYVKKITLGSIRKEDVAFVISHLSSWYPLRSLNHFWYVKCLLTHPPTTKRDINVYSVCCMIKWKVSQNKMAVDFAISCTLFKRNNCGVTTFPAAFLGLLIVQLWLSRQEIIISYCFSQHTKYWRRLQILFV